MPNKHTFLIKPIRKLIFKYGGDFKGWIDPFAGENSPAEITNDLNPEKHTNYHLEAKNFAEILNDKYYGCLFDPPYSTRQTMEIYNSIGLKFQQKNSQECVHFGIVKDIISNKIINGGIVISFGWNSSGFGKNRGFKIIEILLVNHGGNGHNDTICTVERKIQDKLF
jgi:hypothetical protein